MLDKTTPVEYKITTLIDKTTPVKNKITTFSGFLRVFRFPPPIKLTTTI